MSKTILYVGCYTASFGSRPAGEGIYVYEFDDNTGAISLLDVAKGTINPSYLMPCRMYNTLYSVNETAAPAVSAFSLNPENGKLALLNTVSCTGNGMCHLLPSSSGKAVYTAQYGSGHISAVSIKNDGTVGEEISSFAHNGKGVNPRRQEHQHAHSVTESPDGKYIYACDLGMDKIMIYKINSDGSLVENEVPYKLVAPGEGPRHMEFHPNGKYLYLVTEMGAKVIAYKYNPVDGSLDDFQTIATLPDGYEGQNTAADIHLTKDGKQLYMSNRGIDNIVLFSVADDGTLSLVDSYSACGKFPRSFALSPSDSFVAIANQGGSLVICRRLESGALEEISSTPIPMAVCAKFYTL